jgi:drug/metabolite transporter (DMT)-like permease
MALALSVAGLVLLAAVFHASCNAIAKSSGDFLLIFSLLSGVAGAVLAVASPMPAPESWPYIAASTMVQFAYYACLNYAYRFGDLGVVYPLARGSAPAMVAIGGAVFAGEALCGREVTGVLVVSLGIASLAFTSRRGQSEPLAIVYAFATGFTIGTYTVIDGLGVRLSGSPGGYIGWLFMAAGGLTFLFITILKGRGTMRLYAPYLARGTIGGVLVVSGYGMVVWALSLGAMAPVAALRETSVIFAAVFGAVFLGEAFGRSRIIAATIVVAGLFVLNVPF